MKFSKETLEVLTGISKINAKAPVNGAVFKEGNNIAARRYRSEAPVLYAQIPDVITEDFAIHDLPKFIAMFTMLDDPEVTIEDKNVVFKSGRKKARMRLVAEHMIESNPKFFERKIVIPSIDFTCNIDKSLMKTISTAAAMFQAPEISFMNEDGKVSLTTYNSKDPRADRFEVQIGEESEWDNFNIIVDVSQIQFLQRDYEINISKRGLLEWKSSDLTYFITCSDKSKGLSR